MRLLNKLIIGLLFFLSNPTSAEIPTHRAMLFDYGFYAPYSQEYVHQYYIHKQTITKSEFAPPVIFKNIEYKKEEPASIATWSLFFLLQTADVWSTNEGMAYDCVYELNPLLPAVPEVYEMVALKTIILGSLLKSINKHHTITNDMLMPTIMISAIVVHNNMRVIDRAKKRCNKR